MNLRAIAVLLSAFISGAASGAEIGLEGSGSESKQFYLRGQIEPGDSERLHRLILDHLQNGAGGMISVSSPGGDAREAQEIASLIRKYHFAVSVVDEGCFSSCFFLFAAAPVRGQRLSPNSDKSAPIGVHRIYLSEKSAVNISLEDYRLVSEKLWRGTSDYLEELQVPSHIIELVRNTASGEIRILSRSEVDSMGFFSPWHREFVKARCGIDFDPTKDWEEQTQIEVFACSAKAIADAQRLTLARDRAFGEP